MKPNTSDDQSSEVASEAQKDEEDYSQEEEDYWIHKKFYWTQKKFYWTKKTYAPWIFLIYVPESHIYVYILSIESIFFAESDLYIGVSWLNPPTHLYLSRTARNPALSIASSVRDRRELRTKKWAQKLSAIDREIRLSYNEEDRPAT